MPAARARFVRLSAIEGSASVHMTRTNPERFKCGYDAGEWLPEWNRCWFAARVVAVERKYGLSVDRAERDSLESILRDCASTRLVVYAPAGGSAAAPPELSSGEVDARAR